MPLRPTPSTAAAPARSTWRLPPRQFTVLCLAMSVVLHAEWLVDAGVAHIVVLSVAALFNWAILSLNLMILASPRTAEGELETVLRLRPTSAAAAALAGSLTRSRHAPFVALCLAMGAALHAQPFVAAAAEIQVHQGVVVCVGLGVAALFNWAILSIHFFVTRTEEGAADVVLGLDRTAAGAPTGSASRHPLQHFVVLCLCTGALLHVEALVDAAAELHIHAGIIAGVALAVMSPFNWAILSLNCCVARRRAAEHDRMKQIQPASAAPSSVRSPHPARLAFLVLAALVSALWFVEPFAAAAEHYLPRAVIVVFVLLFALLFNASIHLFRSFFLPRSPSSGADAIQGQSVRAMTAGVTCVGIAVAACLVGAVGPAYYV